MEKPYLVVWKASIKQDHQWTFEKDNWPDKKRAIRVIGDRPTFEQGDGLMLSLLNANGQAIPGPYMITLTPISDNPPPPFEGYTTLEFPYYPGTALLLRTQPALPPKTYHDWQFTVAPPKGQGEPIDPEFQVGPGNAL